MKSVHKVCHGFKSIVSILLIFIGLGNCDSGDDNSSQKKLNVSHVEFALPYALQASGRAWGTWGVENISPRLFH